MVNQDEVLGMVEMTIYRSIDSTGDKWELVIPSEVPLWITGNPEVIARFKAGEGAQGPNEEQWWIGVPVQPDPPRILRLQ